MPSQATGPDGTCEHRLPAQLPIGLLALMMLPVRSAVCESCTYWPAESWYVTGVPAAVPLTPAPPVIATLGLIVTSVPSSAATTPSQGCALPIVSGYAVVPT